MNKILFAAVATVMLATKMFVAQAQTAASASATIVVPTTASKQSSLEFNNIHVVGRHTAYMSTAVAVDPKDIISATIRISGNPEYAYSVIVPAHISVSAKKLLLTVGTEVSNKSAALSKDGTADVRINGALSVTDTRDIAAGFAVNDRDLALNTLPVIINND